MTYSQYLNSFVQDFLRVLSWIKLNLFPLETMFSDYLVFTLIGFGFFMLIIEEVVGIITSFRFGGFIFRHFRVLSPRSYQVPDTFPDYSKEKIVRPYRPFYKASYRQKYTGKYFIRYNGRYYPVHVPRYNPFAIAKFNAAYKAGNIVSYDSLYKANGVTDYKGSAFKGIGKFIAGHYKGHTMEDNTEIVTQSSGAAEDSSAFLVDPEADDSLWQSAMYSSRLDFSDGGSETTGSVEGGEFSDYFGISYEDE